MKADQRAVRVPIADIVRDRTFTVRDRVSAPLVQQYANVLRSGATMPPVLVALVNGAMVLVDGHHRVAAHVQLGLPFVEADLVETKAEEVRWRAAEANFRHGERLKPREVRTAFHAFIQARRHLKPRTRRDEPHGLLSYRDIARELGGTVTHTTVLRWMEADFPNIARRMSGEAGPAGNDPPGPEPADERFLREATEALQKARAAARGVRDPGRRGAIIAAAEATARDMATDGPFLVPPPDEF